MWGYECVDHDVLTMMHCVLTMMMKMMMCGEGVLLLLLLVDAYMQRVC